MPTPQKAATPRPKAGRGAKMSTRASVAEMRHSTLASLDDFRESREQTSREADIERKHTVREMMDGFRRKRAETARDLNARLQQNMKELQQSVLQARREVDARISEIAAKRKAFAPKLARMLTKAHDLTAKAQHETMQGLAEARETATHAVQADLEHFAKGMRHDVEAFRKTMRAEIGNGVAKPEGSPAKSKASTARAAPVKAKANGAKKPAVMAAKAPAAPKLAAKPKMQAAKPAAPKPKAKASPKFKPAAAKR